MRGMRRKREAQSFNLMSARAIKKTDEVYLINIQSVLDQEAHPLSDIVSEFPEVFSEKLLGPSGKIKAEHNIELVPGTSPVTRPMIRLSPDDLDDLRKTIAELLKNGAIRASTSPWGAPVLLVKKKDGSKRLVIDYRGLNKVTVKDSYPLPRIDDLMNRLHGARIFTALDLTSGYHQVPLSSNSASFSAFRTRYGSFEFTVMPFGLCNAPSTFMRVMNNVLGDFVDKFVLIYLDDVLIFSKSLEEHRQHVRLVLERLKEHGLICKPSKCSFAKPEIDYLGHHITSEGCGPMLNKVEAIQAMGPPTTVKGVQQFLGMTGYYRNFIKNYADLTACLTDLTQKNTEFKWTQEHQKAFETLKEAFSTTPILRSPNMSLPFKLYTDASNKAIGAVICQDFADGEHPIAFDSRKLNDAQQAYPAYNKELLAIHEFTKRWRHLFREHRLIILTDHKPLVTMLEQKDFSSPMVANWVTDIAEFCPEIRHIAGKENCVADALSRPSALTAILGESIIMDTHRALGHAAIKSTLKTLRDQGWKGSESGVTATLSSCKSCQAVNYQPRSASELHPIHSENLFEKIAIDFAGPLPRGRDRKEYILVAVDCFSKFPFAAATVNADSATVIKFLQELFAITGPPKTLLSDNGPAFASAELAAYLDSANVKVHHTFSSAHRPEANGMAERMVGNIKSTLTKILVEKGGSWTDHLAATLQGIRCRPSSSLGLSPYEVVFNRKAPLVFGSTPPATIDSHSDSQPSTTRKSARLALRKTAAKAVTRHLRSSSIQRLQQDDLELVKLRPQDRKILGPRWSDPSSPFSVLKQLEGDAYMLKSKDDQPLQRAIHRDKLKLVKKGERC